MASASPSTIPLRFQRQELRAKADLSEAGLAELAAARGPEALVEALVAAGRERDAVAALAIMLPRRYAVWWACLVLRLVPELVATPREEAAVAAAEAWVQTQRETESERAEQEAALDGAALTPARCAAYAAFWGGPTLAPRGQQAVPPPPHLSGVAVRTALSLALSHPVLAGRIGYGDLLEIGMALMQGDLGRKAQDAVRARVARG